MVGSPVFRDSSEPPSHLRSCALLLRMRSLKEQKRHTALSVEGTEAALALAKNGSRHSTVETWKE